MHGLLHVGRFPAMHAIQHQSVFGQQKHEAAVAADEFADAFQRQGDLAVHLAGRQVDEAGGDVGNQLFHADAIPQRGLVTQTFQFGARARSIHTHHRLDPGRQAHGFVVHQEQMADGTMRGVAQRDAPIALHAVNTQRVIVGEMRLNVIGVETAVDFENLFAGCSRRVVLEGIELATVAPHRHRAKALQRGIEHFRYRDVADFQHTGELARQCMQ